MGELIGDVLGGLLGAVLDSAKGIVVAIVLMALALVFGAYVISTYAVEHTATCTVQEKSFSQSSSGSTYRISTKECGVLDVTDNWLKHETHSADIYYSIHKGKTYEFSYTGYRIPLLSEFPKVFKAEPVAA